MRDQAAQQELIRHLREVAADEIKYFPGVLGNPVTYAARWGLPLSKSYLAHKAKELRAVKRSIAKSNAKPKSTRRAAVKH
jgi:hypothetical protein